MFINKKAQVWIETVLYTLIGLGLIGVVLVFAIPKINESKDKTTVEQAVASLSDVDSVVNDILKAPGNSRKVELTMKKGEMTIYGSDTGVNANKIIYTISGLTKPYSEPGVPVQYGSIIINSTKGAKTSSVDLILDYSGRFNLTWDGKDEEKTLAAASVPYEILIENQGAVGNGKVTINLHDIAGG